MQDDVKNVSYVHSAANKVPFFAESSEPSDSHTIQNRNTVFEEEMAERDYERGNHINVVRLSGSYIDDQNNFYKEDVSMNNIILKTLFRPNNNL